MKSMTSGKRAVFEPNMPANGQLSGHGHPRGEAGFTLVEIMVVVVIILVLAGLAMMGYGRYKVSAAKLQTVSDMRQIHLGVAMWASEHNRGEPFYGANGTGSYSHEAVPGINRDVAPGNPAMALYFKDNPESGYVSDYTLFFNPLTTYETPSIEDYDPAQASTTNLWGTYAWYYPSLPKEELSTRQDNALYEWGQRRMTRAARGKLLMAPDYLNCEPKWDRIYVAMMVDGSVNAVADNEIEWRKWLYED